MYNHLHPSQCIIDNYRYRFHKSSSIRKSCRVKKKERQSVRKFSNSFLHGLAPYSSLSSILRVWGRVWIILSRKSQQKKTVDPWLYYLSNLQHSKHLRSRDRYSRPYVCKAGEDITRLFLFRICTCIESHGVALNWLSSASSCLRRRHRRHHSCYHLDSPCFVWWSDWGLYSPQLYGQKAYIILTEVASALACPRQDGRKAKKGISRRMTEASSLITVLLWESRYT